MSQLFQTPDPQSTEPPDNRTKAVRVESRGEEHLGLAVIALQTHAFHANKNLIGFRRGPLHLAQPALPTGFPEIHRHKMPVATECL